LVDIALAGDVGHDDQVRRVGRRLELSGDGLWLELAQQRA
jgi:hypothetical protein